MRKQGYRISIVVPAFNEQSCLLELVRRIDRALGALGGRAEILVVDDRSTDGSFEIVRELAARDPRVRGVRLSRNVGAQAALLCGLALARGDVVVALDADLQHPPERIPDMVKAWEQGSDVVNMLRSRHERLGPLRGALTWAFYGIFRALSDAELSPRSTSFHLLDRRCVDALLQMKERVQFLRGMVWHIGFSQTRIVFDSPERFAGESGHTLSKLFRVALDALFSFSTRVMVLPIYVGLATFLGTAVAAAFLLAKEPLPQGLVMVLFIVVSGLLWGLLFLSLGLLGAFLSRLMTEVKDRPPYFIDETVGAGFSGDAERRDADAAAGARSD